jgi:glucose/arabinose dehydrogenase
LPELYTIGHRNPQGLALHPVTGDVWLGEHGPQGGDELNRLEPGKNYGWPVIITVKNTAVQRLALAFSSRQAWSNLFIIGIR